MISHYLDENTEQSLVKLAKKSKRLVFFYVRPREQLNFQDHQHIKLLKNQGVVVQVLSEEQLIQQEFEVST